MLAVARVLMAEPKLLILDEASAGVAPIVAELLFQKLVEMHETKTIFSQPDVRFININVAEFDAAKQAGLMLVGDARATIERLAARTLQVAPAYRDEAARQSRHLCQSWPPTRRCSGTRQTSTRAGRKTRR